tara:strand:+ start:65 stop:430 length:366 start_codon:yes stop_codon:yes gene_type:complete
MSKINKDSQDAWLATISKNYRREMNSPFELNMMEAKIRKSIHSPQKKSSGFTPAFAFLFSVTLVLGWILLPEQSADFAVEANHYVQVDEPNIQLFSSIDLEPSEDNFLPDDYITISQVMFD